MAGCQLGTRHRAIWGIGGSLVEFQGCRVGLTFNVLLRFDAVFFCEASKQTIKPSVAYVARTT